MKIKTLFDLKAYMLLILCMVDFIRSFRGCSKWKGGYAIDLPPTPQK